ncbi:MULTISPECIES: molybdopterin-dependent oxidoreductase [Streptosporangium]|uniref:DMSO/TMAO reductase YedYZ molybdopterin-dependent catalytic subunit n=1 Tax=Streptosporangium brasiliense TaxID=47480 RepID=A0ABT9RI95_9ACTN|nr:molybdopterin-dependent oxidoreductase [Streptosporangium brasiliense]MDP9868567.1 DMSO/TMAO reductase YedYZ molybdopterin-dependent catalytic subunit [Streptosporangium brasiliense]
MASTRSQKPSAKAGSPRRGAAATAIALLVALTPATAAAAAPTVVAGPSSIQQAVTGTASARAVTVKIRGHVDHPRSFTVARLRSLPQHTVHVRYETSHGPEKHTFTGPLLSEVLKPAKPRIDAGAKNAHLRLFVTATGSDGYRATVAWAELDAAFSGRKVLLAVAQDGSKLDKEGPRLVVPGDVKGGRYVSGVVRLYVGDPA